MIRLSIKTLCLGLASLACLLVGSSADAGIIDWATVGDPGNAADTDHGGYGAVATSFKIMKYEFTNQQYADFLNSVAASDTYSLYNQSMGSDVRGGITRSGASGSYSYAVRTNMGDKPVNFVSWFDAARVSNWYQNGATSSSSTETGAYTLGGATTGNAVARNAGATYYIPTEDEWYKAAYYKAGGTDAGYWRFPTQSDTLGTAYPPDSQGNGSSRAINGSFANYNDFMKWGLPSDGGGNVTTVGLNGAPSAYGTFDMAGNIREVVETFDSGSAVARGGSFASQGGPFLQTHVSRDGRHWGAVEDVRTGFRIAAVPEPSTYAMALAGLACGGWQMWRRRRLRHTRNG